MSKLSPAQMEFVLRRVRVELGRLGRGCSALAEFEFVEDRMRLGIRMELNHGNVEKSDHEVVTAKDSS